MTLLKNQYRLLQELGSGAFGKTYLAEDTHSPSSRRCVIKHLTWNNDPRMAQLVRDRFQREAAILEMIGRGSQGGIPELFAYFIDNEQYYLVQEWIDGETLTHKLRREGPQPEHIVKNILLGSLQALEYIHTRPTPIIHRDIKPDNVMIRRANGQPVLIDFGVVKEVTQIEPGGGQASTIMVGTSGFMPLEQAAGRPVFASDIFSLGMTAITMLTGKHPRELTDPQSGDIIWRPLAPHVSSGFADVIDIATRRFDRERYQSAKDMAAALQGASQAMTSGPRPSPVTIAATSMGPGSSFGSGDPRANQPMNPTMNPSVSPQMNPTMSPQMQGQPAGVTDMINSMSSGQGARKKSGWLIPVLVILFLIIVVPVGGVGVWYLMKPTADPGKPNPPSDPGKPVVDGGTTTPATPETPEGMTLIKGGKFTMGDDEGAEDSEKPAHEVDAPSFFIDRNEVTNADYAKFVKQTGHKAPENWRGGNYPEGEGDYPVANVTWNDAAAYAKWAGKRLPTEIEWEFAARGTEGRKYPWGNDFDQEKLNSKESGNNQAKSVADFPDGATPEKVYNLAGNVAEWTASDDSLYPGSTAKLAPGSKIVRGGGFSLDRKYASATKRTQVPPDTTDPALGFRCAKDAK